MQGERIANKFERNFPPLRFHSFPRAILLQRFPLASMFEDFFFNELGFDS